jgi:hypothetical protein
MIYYLLLCLTTLILDILATVSTPLNEKDLQIILLRQQLLYGAKTLSVSSSSRYSDKIAF